jgi:hypothetical protein
MSRKGTSKRKSASGVLTKSLLAAVPLLALVWAIVTFNGVPRTETLKREEAIGTEYVRLEHDAIADFVEGNSFPFGQGRVRYPQSGLAKELLAEMSPAAVRKNGRTIGGATFLHVVNRGTTDVQSVSVDDGAQTSYGSLGPGDSLVVCVRLERRDGTAVARPISRVVFETTAVTFARVIRPTPAVEQMSAVTSSAGVLLFYAPSPEQSPLVKQLQSPVRAPTSPRPPAH